MSYDETEIARLARAFRSAPEDAEPRPDCPPAEQIWLAVHEEVSSADFRRLLDHLAVCPLCTESWLIADEMKTLHRESTPAQQPVSESPRRLFGAGTALGQRWAAVASTATATLRDRWVPAAVAATLLVVASAVVVQTRSAPPPGYRTLSNGEIELLTDVGEPLPRQDCRLRWSGPEEARYLVRVLRGFQVIDEVPRTEATEHTVPEDKLRQLPAGTQLDLYLEAYLPSERRSIARTFTFAVR